MTLEIAADCRHYLGDRPCRFKARCRCPQYDSVGTRILIIKTGALGDVVRTACLLPSLKRTYPQSRVTWVTKPNGVRILKGHPLVDRLIPFDSEGILIASRQCFDLVLSLDKEAGPAALCHAVQCPDKRGIGLSPWGTVVPCNSACEDYFELGLDDHLKFKCNRKSYPELIHAALELDYHREPYRLYFDSASGQRARQMFSLWRMDDRPVVGLNTGSGSVFAHKVPKPSRWVDLARTLLGRKYTVVLTGGPEEAEMNEWIAEQVGPDIHNTGSDNNEPQFTAIIDQCDVLITGDTLALHVAISRDVPVVALFGPTCEQEIDLFGLGRKIVSADSCGPCYKRHCDRKPSCMDAISLEEIVAGVDSICAVSQTALAPSS
jgi:ADP-heptose:LPS heptosyltransferase